MGFNNVGRIGKNIFCKNPEPDEGLEQYCHEGFNGGGSLMRFSIGGVFLLGVDLHSSTAFTKPEISEFIGALELI